MKKIILLITAGLIIFVFVSLVVRNRDQRIIKKKMNTLAMTLSKSRNEGALVFVTKTGRMNNLFTQNCLIELQPPVPRIQGLETLIAAFSHFQRSVDSMDVGFYDVSIRVDKNSKTAKAVMTAKATGPNPRDGVYSTDARELEMEWAKVESKWRISKIIELKTLH